MRLQRALTLAPCWFAPSWHRSAHPDARSLCGPRLPKCSRWSHFSLAGPEGLAPCAKSVRFVITRTTSAIWFWDLNLSTRLLLASVGPVGFTNDSPPSGADRRGSGSGLPPPPLTPLAANLALHDPFESNLVQGEQESFLVRQVCGMSARDQSKAQHDRDHQR